ncbi:ATP-grasp domain-containing protein [Chondrinema litorale]|uniref:ATP-grasp domain-containing protein n=1 Tax=Chondrinema litorale TaxID=2994555 RepID=UPI002543E07F|nr:hypothetical protein [Chondrinema litorale]UZR93863.1 hypothetical protein OQ292_18610 [Chondrinema litorale]
MNIGIVTCNEQPDLIPTERFLPFLLQKTGNVEVVIWNDPTVIWQSFDVLIIRSVWDYHLQYESFIKWLDEIENANINVFNPISVLRKNLHKFYLKELLEKGFPIIPTHFLPVEEVKTFSLEDLCIEKRWQKIVVKPAISATAWNAYKLENTDQIKNFEFPIVADWLIQPFVPEIIEFGEISLMFFNRKYSHAVVKKSSTGDFRVQEEFGGRFTIIEPNNLSVKTALEVLESIEGDLLYSRVDGVITADGFQIMEVELIEPEMFLLDNLLQRKFSKSIEKKIVK